MAMKKMRARATLTTAMATAPAFAEGMSGMSGMSGMGGMGGMSGMK